MQGEFYKGEDLGASYNKNNTAFRIWAPTADGVSAVSYTHLMDSLDAK